jgi:hypothetical protein
MSEHVIEYPLTASGVFSAVYRLRPSFKVLCEDVLRISATGEGPSPVVNGARVPTSPKWRKVQALLQKLRRQGLIESLGDCWAPTDIVTDASLVCDLLLVTIDEGPTEATIARWLPWDRAQVVLWAWCTQLRASDNANIRVPPRPDVLKEYQ